jgi:uncharacterized protein involved in outer membrane biogenesis
MKINNYLARLIKYLLVIVVILAFIQSIFIFANVKFTSDKARHILVDHLKNVTQREINIEGHVQITVSLLPEVIVDRIHIKNPDGFDDEDFVYIAEAFVKFSLFHLLTGNLVFNEIEGNNVQIRLVHKKDGSDNWSFDELLQHTEQSTEKKIKTTNTSGDRKYSSIGVVRLADISISYKDETANRVIENHVSSLMVNLEKESGAEAQIKGLFQGYPYNIAFVSDSLSELSTNNSWKLSGNGKIADRKTAIESVIQINGQEVKGNLDINIENINLGMLLEHIGIATGEDAACRNMNIHVAYNGNAFLNIVQKAEIELHLENGFWKWRSLLNEHTRVLNFNKVVLQSAWNKPVELKLDGEFVGEAVNLQFISNRLSEFFDELEMLDIDLAALVADSNIVVKGSLGLPVDKEEYRLDISFKGKDLEKLNSVLNSELPPFNNYSLSGNITSNKHGYVVRAEDATIGDTHFNGVIVIDTSSFKPFWKINLNSRQLQIRDFEFIDLKMEDENLALLKDSLKRTDIEADKRHGRRLKKIVDNPRMHMDLSVNVEQVMAGDSALGSSSIRLKLRDDSLILEDAEINVPGGKINSAASFMVNEQEVTGSFKLDVDKFEYGAVARYFKPGSPEGGVISTRIDVQLGGPDFMHLFDNAIGKLDVALWPRNTKTKIFDLWATNLFLIILPEIKKKESRMNCMVALMDIDEGIMKEDFFGIDTTRVWMTGNITVDFKQEHVSLSLFPRSKTARLFAVQAPIRAQGDFDDIKLVTSPIDLTAAYISFVTSPLHVPARWLFERKVPEDASEACESFFDREYVKQLKAKLDAEEKNEIDEWMESD